MSLSCCPQAGVFCPTYQRSDLYGRIWEMAHGINCSEGEFEKIQASLLSQLPETPKIMPDAVAIEAQQIEQTAPATQPKRTQKRRGCGCGRKLQPI